MTKLFTVVTNNRVARIDIVASLVPVTTGTRLAIITEMDQDLTKTDEIRDMLFDSHAKVAHAILNMGSTFFSEITVSMVENIAILCQALNDGFIRHFMRSINNLHIR